MSPSNPSPKPPPKPDGVKEPPDIGRSIGRFMIVGFWLLVLFLGYTWANRHLAWMHNPNQSPSTTVGEDRASVVLAMNRQGHYVATGTINQTSVVFLLDTGATTVALPARLASDLGLQPGEPVNIATANGVTTGWRVRLDSVAVGDLELRDVDALINPGQGDNDVLLGMSFLKHFKLIQQKRQLTIEQY